MKQKKYYSLYLLYKELILNDKLTAGQKLPSKRVAADRAGVSVITVENAYRLLAEEGYIEPREKSGYFVCDIGGVPMRSDGVRKLEFLPEEPMKSDCDVETALWFKTVRRVMAENGNVLAERSPAAGCAVLRNAIAAYLLRCRGMFAPPERIIIGSGAEQLYEMVVRLVGRDLVYGIEFPSYRQIEAVYQAAGVQVDRLRMGPDGIESAELRRTEATVLHVTPFHSYPTGVTAGIAKRNEYLASVPGGYIVEDDFDSEFFPPGQPIESLYSLDTADQVIYINTFSKSISPGMRMGYMILPERLLPAYREKMDDFCCTVPVFDQYVLAEFIANGSFERHISRMRRKLKK